MQKFIVGKNDMASLHPELLEEWDYKNNKKYDPYKMFVNGSQSINWICKSGHQWTARIYQRTRTKSQCPFCNGIYAIPGETDLETLYPDIALEWDYDKNNDIPSKILPMSGMKVYWKCKNGHSWPAVIENRVIEQTGCPKCKGETQTSFPEQCIYYYIAKTVECINRYNDLGFEIDVFIPSLRIGIEYDGYYSHISKDAIFREKVKDEKIKEYGIKLYRIKESKSLLEDTNSIFYVKNDNKKYDRLKKILEDIFDILYQKNHSIKTPDIDIVRDRFKIWEQYKSWIKDNSILKLYPDIAKQWFYEKNGKNTPDVVYAHSHDIVYWRCEKGHDWPAKVSHRTSSNGTGCPYCANKKVWKGFNDFGSVFPHLVSEWDYSKNSLSPYEVIATTNYKKIHWICSKCAFPFEQTPYKRGVKGQGCPACAGVSVHRGYNDFATVYPELAKEWDYTKNNKKPWEISYGSSIDKYYWICSDCGKSYLMTPAHKASGRGCNECAKIKRIETRHRNNMLQGNSLAQKFPSLLEEWDFELNKNLDPNDISFAANISVNWICKKNPKHKWTDYINNRTKKNKPYGCRYCSGKLAFPGETDLCTTHPDIVIDWDYEKNDVDPTKVKAGSETIANWKCHICGNSWSARITDRTHGRYKCSVCRKNNK